MLRLFRWVAIAAAGLVASPPMGVAQDRAPASRPEQLRGPSVAQPWLAAPLSSPLWWTLSDEVSRERLYLAHAGDVAGSMRRYLHAVERGEVPPLPAARLERLEFFVRGSLTPGLIPLWTAFNDLAQQIDIDPRWEVRALALLERHGVSAAGREQVIAAVHAYLQDGSRIVEQRRSDRERLKQVIHAAETKMTSGEIKRALEAKSARPLAAATGRRPAQLRKLFKALDNPWAIAAPPRLAELRRNLQGEDWAGFRALLREELAPRLTLLGFQSLEEGVR